MVLRIVAFFTENFVLMVFVLIIIVEFIHFHVANLTILELVKDVFYFGIRRRNTVFGHDLFFKAMGMFHALLAGLAEDKVVAFLAFEAHG